MFDSGKLPSRGRANRFRGIVNESRKRGRKFLVSSGDAALAFESSEELLYMVTLPK